MSGITRQLAEYVAHVSEDEIPADVVECAKLLVLDLLGSALGGADLESSGVVRNTMLELAAPGEASVVASERRVPAPFAALLNGLYAHSLDFDDTFGAGSIHPGAVVIPGVLALAEERRHSGRDVLRAVVAGYEVTCRLAGAVDPKRHYARGFHPTATLGPFGAATGAASLLRMSPDSVANLLGIALSNASGTLRFLTSSAWTKRLHAGIAGYNGLVAVRLAERGFVGADDAIEGDHGLLAAYTDTPHPEAAVADLGTAFRIREVDVKPFPAGRYSHAPLEAVLRILSENALQPEEIEAIHIGVSEVGLRNMALPADRKRRPRTFVEAQFSIPFQVAVAVRLGHFGLDGYELVGDPAVAEMADRIVVDVDAEAERAYPARWMATVEVRARRRTFAIHGHESISRPSWESVPPKFMGLAAPVVGDEAARRIVEIVRSLNEASDVAELAALLRSGRPVSAAVMA